MHAIVVVYIWYLCMICYAAGRRLYQYQAMLPTFEQKSCFFVLTFLVSERRRSQANKKKLLSLLHFIICIINKYMFLFPMLLMMHRHTVWN